MVASKPFCSARVGSSHEKHDTCIHVGGPSYLRPYQRHELEAERLGRVRLSRDRTLTIYRAAGGYLVLKQGSVPYLGEESFAYFLKPGEDPEKAVEPKACRGRGKPPREEWARLDPRIERGLEAPVLEWDDVEEMVKPYVEPGGFELLDEERQKRFDAYWTV